MKKKITGYGIIISVIVFLVGCSGSKAPSKEMIKEDLEKNIVNAGEFLKLKDYEIIQSVTEDKNFTATIAVEASGNYADFELEANVSYIKYDQGWQITDCSWLTNSYEVTSYPSEKEMTKMVNNLVGPMEYSEMTCDKNQICFKGEINDYYEECKYINGKVIVTSLWNYNPGSDTWEYQEDSKTEESICEVTDKLAGSWEIYDDDDPADFDIIVSNVSPTGFDIECTCYKTNTVHVEMEDVVDSPDSIYFYGTGATADADHYKAENADVKVRLCLSDFDNFIQYNSELAKMNGLRIEYMIDGGSNNIAGVGTVALP